MTIIMKEVEEDVRNDGETFTMVVCEGVNSLERQ